MPIMVINQKQHRIWNEIQAIPIYMTIRRKNKGNIKIDSDSKFKMFLQPGIANQKV